MKRLLAEQKTPYKLWEQHSATDKEIAACKGDYIGCEICRWSKRCAMLLIKKLKVYENGKQI